jgi:hypothetical protein
MMGGDRVWVSFPSLYMDARKIALSKLSLLHPDRSTSTRIPQFPCFSCLTTLRNLNMSNDVLQISRVFERLRAEISLPSKGKQNYLEEYVRSIWMQATAEGYSKDYASNDMISKNPETVDLVWSQIMQIRETLRNLQCHSMVSILGVLWDEGIHCMSSELDDIVLSVTEFISDGSQLVGVFCTYNTGHCWLLKDLLQSQWYMHDGSKNQLFGTWPQSVDKLSSTGRWHSSTLRFLQMYHLKFIVPNHLAN